MNLNPVLESVCSKKSAFPKILAKVILCRCVKKAGNENLFGTRIEERGKIWYRTWSFQISEEKAKNEGWNSQTIETSLNVTPEYNGCPYCGSFSLAQCGVCGKLFCFGNENYADEKQVEMKCPWCTKISVYQSAETMTIQSGEL